MASMFACQGFKQSSLHVGGNGNAAHDTGPDLYRRRANESRREIYDL